jgi:hypothetical protein
VFDARGGLVTSDAVVDTPSLDLTTYYAWRRVDDRELRAEVLGPSDEVDASQWFRLRLTSGERGCDAIEWTKFSDGKKRETVHLYRGAVCLWQNVACPDEPFYPEGHPCTYYHYAWCEEQGANIPNPDPESGICGQDCYCTLPDLPEDE